MTLRSNIIMHYNVSFMCSRNFRDSMGLDTEDYILMHPLDKISALIDKPTLFVYNLLNKSMSVSK